MLILELFLMVAQALKSLMVSARAERESLRAASFTGRAGMNRRFVTLKTGERTSIDLECQVRFNRYAQLLALMETASESPSLEFRTVSQTLGLEYLQTIRNGAASDINQPIKQPQ